MLPNEVYTVVAGAMRYIFVLLGILIVLRAFLMLRRDRRETDRALRRLPDAGLIGEFEILRGSEYLEEGSVLPLPSEGTLGYYRSCDLTLPCPGVRKRHLDFMLDDRYGLLIHPRAGCLVTVDGFQLNTRSRPETHPMLHGSEIEIGTALLRLRLFAGVCPERGAAFMPDTQPVISSADTVSASLEPDQSMYMPPVSASRDPFQNTSEAISDLANMPSRLSGMDSRPAPGSPIRTRHTNRRESEWSE